MAARNAGKKAPSKKKNAEDDKRYLCPYCLKEKKKSEFYMSSDPMVLTGITTMCKECARKIAMNWDERTKEFGILASLGADSSKLSGIVLTEGFMIGLAGGLIGTAVSVAVIMIFGGTIVNVMELPQLNSDIAYMLMLGLRCTGLALVVSVAASLYSAWKVSRNNLDALIKGEEM